MRILIITYSYTPDLTPRAFRWSAIAEYLAARGHCIDVVCAAEAEAEPPGNGNGVTVHRVRDWLLNASARVSPGAGAPRTPGGTFVLKLRRMVKSIVRSAWRAVFWPDYACGWVIPAARLTRELMGRNEYDWIISVSHPFTSHLVGLLGRGRRTEARWLVDIGDPFFLMAEPPPNNRRLFAGLNRVVEERVLAVADAICVTTVETMRAYQEHFRSSREKITVIPPLLSLPDTNESPAESPDGTVKLVYIGTLYRKLRSPERLLTLFRALMKHESGIVIELHFYGSVNDCSELFLPYQEFLNSRLFIHGLVGRAEVADAMRKATVLVNIGNDSDTQLATKVIEYMAVGKPILNLASGERDASVAALMDYPASCTITRSEDVTSPERLRCISSFLTRENRVDQSVSGKIRREYSATNIGARYDSLLNGIVGPR